MIDTVFLLLKCKRIVLIYFVFDTLLISFNLFNNVDGCKYNHNDWNRLNEIIVGLNLDKKLFVNELLKIFNFNFDFRKIDELS